VLLDVLRVHPQVVIGPDVCDNPHFVPPAEFYSAGRAAAELRRWMQGLSERKRAEEALREREERLSLAIAGTGVGAWDWNIQTGATVYSERWAEIAGYALAELEPVSQETWRDLVHPEDLERSDEALRRHLAGELERYECEFRMKHKDGRWVWVHDRGMVVEWTDDGEPLRIAGTHSDITERRRAEEALRQAEERMELFFSQSLDGFFFRMLDEPVHWNDTADKEKVLDYVFAHQRITKVNDAMLAQYGATREQFTGLTPNDMFAHDIAHGRRFWREFFDAGHLHVDTDERKFDGTKMWIEGDYICMYDSEGRITGHFGAQRDITEQRRAEEALKNSLSLVEATLESTDNGILVVNREGAVVKANGRFAEMWRIPGDVLASGDDEKLLDHVLSQLSDPDAFLAKVKALYGEPRAESADVLYFKDGRVFERISKPMLVGGEPTARVWSFLDVTDRKRAEEALRKSEARYRRIAEGLTDYQYSVDIEDGRAVETTQGPACARVTGYTAEEYAADPYLWIQMVLPEDRERVREHARLILAGEDVPSIEHRIVRKDGEVRWVRDTAIPLKDASGRLLSYDGVISDITERKRVEAALRKSENRIQSIFRAAPTGIGVVRDRILLEVNTRICEMTGYRREELVGNSARILYPTQEDFENVGREEYRQIAEEGTGSVETRWMKKDGSIIDVLLSSTPIEPSDLSVGVTFAALDITERKRAEEELRLRSSALNAAANAVVITDREGNLEWVNQAFLALTGYGEDEVIGRNPRVLIRSGAHDRVFYEGLWNTVLAGDVWHGELTNRRKDGSFYSEEMTITPLRDARGEIRHFIAVKQDITEKKLLQAEFVQSQKMESVGRLAGGIAHDFNNLLSVINGYAELAVADRSLSNPLRAQIVAIHRAGERAATLTRQLLAFSRRQTVAPVVLDLNAAVRAIQKMLERLIGEDITLISAPTEPLGRVRADPGQVEQIVMNLAINARDAMPEGGMLSIETANVGLDREAAERASVKPGSYVMLAISDTGMGMDEVTREHIFEPFFTTKGVGKGTGLGLAIVYGIVQQFGGGIQVTSAVGQGSTFTIYLPRVEAAVGEEAATPPAPAEEVGGTETILVVEDDESLRTMAADVLASAGYTVLKARHGEEALQMLARHGEPVHLVFTDMVMPGMGGLELAKEIGKTHPQIRVLFTSGFASDPTAGRVAPEELTHFICKPYSVGQLARKVREVLDWLW
jgi:PAS domain S-box-containing protein